MAARQVDGTKLPICCACGSQYHVPSPDYKAPDRCRICDDPRQFVPPSGQQWTTLSKLREGNENLIEKDEREEGVWHIYSKEKFGIGQRAVFLQTEEGNVLWDCIALLDRITIDLINSKGGLEAIVISHPHFYTTYADWSATFKCPVWISKDDEEWLCRRVPECIHFIEGPSGTKVEVIKGVTAVKCGGHFDGSLVLHWKNLLGVSDTMMTVPSAYSPYPRPPGQITYSYMWAIPNMIPLPPPKIHAIWNAIKDLEYDTSYGNFYGMTVHDQELKKRTLFSMKAQVKAQGYENHPLLAEEV